MNNCTLQINKYLLTYLRTGEMKQTATVSLHRTSTPWRRGHSDGCRKCDHARSSPDRDSSCSSADIYSADR